MILLGLGRMQRDAAAEVGEGHHLLRRRCIDSGIAVARAMDFDFPAVVGMETVRDHDRKHGTETKALVMGRVSFVGTKERVTLLESEVVPGKMEQEIRHVGTEKVRALGHMRGTEMAVLERLLSVDTASGVLGRLLCCTGVAVEAPETLPCCTAVVAVVLETLPVVGTGTEQGVQVSVLLRTIHVWMAVLGRRSGSMATVMALCRKPGTGTEEPAIQLEAGTAVEEERVIRPYGIVAAVVALAIQLWEARARLPSTVVGMCACAKIASTAAALATQLSRRVFDTAAVGWSLCEHEIRVCRRSHSQAMSLVVL